MNKLFTLFVSALLLPIWSMAQGANFWSDIAENDIQKNGERQIVPLQYRSIRLDIEGLKNFLAAAPFSAIKQL